MSDKPERVEITQIEDAMKTGVEILAPQLGTDGAKLAQGLIDIRRATRLSKLQMIPISHFLASYDTGYYARFFDHFLNVKTSEEGHERVKYMVKALEAIGGATRPPAPKKDDRGLLARNIWARNKKTEGDET